MIHLCTVLFGQWMVLILLNQICRTLDRLFESPATVLLIGPADLFKQVFSQLDRCNLLQGKMHPK